MVRFWDRWVTDGGAPPSSSSTPSGKSRDITPTSEELVRSHGPRRRVRRRPPTTSGIACLRQRHASAPTPACTGIFTVPLSDGGPAGDAVVCITPDNPADDHRPRYSPDGRWLVYGQRRDPSNFADRIRIVRVDRRTGEHLTLTEGWDCSPSAWEFAAPGTCPRGRRARPHQPLPPVHQRRRPAGAGRARRHAARRAPRRRRLRLRPAPRAHPPPRDRALPGHWRADPAAQPLHRRGARRLRAGPRRGDGDPRRRRRPAALLRGAPSGPPRRRPRPAGADRPRRPLRHARRPLALALERPDLRRARLCRGSGRFHEARRATASASPTPCSATGAARRRTTSSSPPTPSSPPAASPTRRASPSPGSLRRLPWRAGCPPGPVTASPAPSCTRRSTAYHGHVRGRHHPGASSANSAASPGTNAPRPRASSSGGTPGGPRTPRHRSTPTSRHPRRERLPLPRP